MNKYYHLFRAISRVCETGNTVTVSTSPRSSPLTRSEVEWWTTEAYQLLDGVGIAMRIADDLSSVTLMENK